MGFRKHAGKVRKVIFYNSTIYLQACKMDIPVNMKFCFEGMEESGSEGLDDLLFARKDTEFMQQVDYVRVHHMFSRILNFLFVIVFSKQIVCPIK